jgi:hypothetical protein
MMPTTTPWFDDTTTHAVRAGLRYDHVTYLQEWYYRCASAHAEAVHGPCDKHRRPGDGVCGRELALTFLRMRTILHAVGNMRLAYDA